MSEYMFGLLRSKPTRARARQMNRICRQEGGIAFVEVNRKEGTRPEVNHGHYQGWFTAPNRGNPFDVQLAARVRARLASEGAAREEEED